jgi:hypothetical protein
LCDKCAEKWTYGHKCAATLQLHVMQELLELFADGTFDSEEVVSTPNEDEAHLYLFLSEAARSGVESPKSLRLLGKIQGHDIVILLDSGSSHTFVSTTMAAMLTGLSALS